MSQLHKHIRDSHTRGSLTAVQLAQVGGRYCQDCGDLRSTVCNRHSRTCTRRLLAEGSVSLEAHHIPGPSAPRTQPPPTTPPPTQPPPTQPGPSAPPTQPLSATPPPTQPPPTQPPPAPAQAYIKSNRTVPFHAKDAWSQAVTAAVDQVTSAQDRGMGMHEAFTALLMLPSQALSDSGAARGRAKRVKARLQHIANGTTPTAAPASQQTSQRRSSQSNYKLAARIHGQLTLGNVSRASKCLEALPIAEPTAAAIAQLQALHPEAPPPELQAAATSPAQLDDDMFQDVLHKLPRGSAPGPSGWTYEHIKAAALHSTSARQGLLRLINAMLAGQLPHLPKVLASSLIGLQKPGGRGLRPIAIPEAFYRLAGLCLIEATDGTGQALAPLQLGVSIRGGSQCIGHALKAGIAADPDCVTAQLDFKNAFNCLDRTAMLKAIAKRQPRALAFATWAYQHASELIVNGAPDGTPPIMSQSGVRQGDPLGPLFFALALQDPLEQVNLTHRGAAPVSYADDGFLQGRAPEVIEAFQVLETLAAELKLTTERSKCGVHSLNAAAAAEVSDALNIRNYGDGFMAAGTPIGTDEYVTAQANDKAADLCKTIDLLADLPLPKQDQLILLRSSLQQRLAHLPRAAPWAPIKDAIHLLEDKVAQTALRVANCPQDTDRRQLTLPLRFGGLGIRTTSALEADAAFISAAAMTAAAMRGGSARFQPFDGPYGQNLRSCWQQLYAAGEPATLWPDDAATVNEACIKKILPDAQSTFSKFTAEHRYDALISSYDISTIDGARNVARLRSCKSRASGIWLDTLPVAPSLRLKNADLVSATRHRLGLSQMPAFAHGIHCHCKRHILPDNVDHAMSCTAVQRPITMRHNMLTETWRRICHRSGIATSAEPALAPLRAGPARNPDAADEYRGDILLVLPEDSLCVADVSVIHPAAQTYVTAAAQQDGAAAARRDQDKRTKYNRIDSSGYTFYPLSTESYGRLGAPAMQLLNKLADIADDTGPIEKDTFVTNALRELSIALCRGNALVYRSCASALNRLTGVAPTSGLLVPTSEIF